MDKIESSGKGFNVAVVKSGTFDRIPKTVMGVEIRESPYVGYGEVMFLNEVQP